MAEIDHRREAEEWLGCPTVWESPDERSTPSMLAALTHAVLALTDAITATPTPRTPESADERGA